MPDDVAARTVYAVGSQFARAGKWAEAREVFALLADRYPGHPLAMDGFRWLLRYHAGSEPRRRVEIQQKIAYGKVVFQPDTGNRLVPVGGASGPAQVPVKTEDVYRMHSQEMIVRWHQACIDFEPRLARRGLDRDVPSAAGLPTESPADDLRPARLGPGRLEVEAKCLLLSELTDELLELLRRIDQLAYPVGRAF